MRSTIWTLDNPQQRDVLTRPALPVDFPFSDDVHACIQQLEKVVSALGGLGLGAPQLGFSLRVVCIYIGELQAAVRSSAAVPLTLLINPWCEPTEDAVELEDWEGCYSVGDLMGKVPRPNRVRYGGQLKDGSFVKGIADGLFARILQHEIDHLDGILLTERLKNAAVKGPVNEMMALRRSELSPEKRELLDQLRVLQSKN